jgi:branched-chain amino acid transport system ATP-binding protein
MLLSVENLQVSYDNIKALHGISFGIEEGEIVCIIGANGAGKSTRCARSRASCRCSRGRA